MSPVPQWFEIRPCRKGRREFPARRNRTPCKTHQNTSFTAPMAVYKVNTLHKCHRETDIFPSWPPHYEKMRGLSLTLARNTWKTACFQAKVASLCLSKPHAQALPALCPSDFASKRERHHPKDTSDPPYRVCAMRAYASKGLHTCVKAI